MYALREVACKARGASRLRQVQRHDYLQPCVTVEKLPYSEQVLFSLCGQLPQALRMTASHPTYRMNMSALG